jgi:hypothetical protein
MFRVGSNAPQTTSGVAKLVPMSRLEAADLAVAQAPLGNRTSAIAWTITARVR